MSSSQNLKDLKARFATSRFERDEKTSKKSDLQHHLPTHPINQPQPTPNLVSGVSYAWLLALRGVLFVGFLGSVLLGFHLDVTWLGYPLHNFPVIPTRMAGEPVFNGRICQGATIVDTWTTNTHASATHGHGDPHPSSLLTGASNRTPWCFSGSKGYVGILLRSPSALGAVNIYASRESSIFHLPWLYTRTAPREVLVWGLIDGHKSRREVQRIGGLPNVTKLFKDTSHLFLLLARLEYDGRRSAPETQQAAIDSLLLGSSVRFGIIIVDIRGNWGGASTCLSGISILEARRLNSS